MTNRPIEQARSQGTSDTSVWRDRYRKNVGWIAGAAGVAAMAGIFIFNRASTRRAEATDPPAGTFIEVDGVRLHYVDQGSGPTVVLLHGNGVTLQDFEVSGVLGLASEQYRVIAFDRPGFGYSDRPRTTIWTPAAQARLIGRALEALDVGAAVIVGHSWGTLVALAMALDTPARVSGLVLLSGYYYGTARPDVWLLSAPATPVLGDLMANTVSPLAARLIAPAAIKASFAPAPVSSKFAAFPLALTIRPSQVRATSADTALMVPSAAAMSSRYPALSVPVIVMAGEGDIIVHGDAHAVRFVQDVASAELRLVPAQGHLLHYAVPDQVVAAIGVVNERAAA